MLVIGVVIRSVRTSDESWKSKNQIEIPSYFAICHTGNYETRPHCKSIVPCTILSRF